MTQRRTLHPVFMQFLSILTYWSLPRINNISQPIDSVSVTLPRPLSHTLHSSFGFYSPVNHCYLIFKLPSALSWPRVSHHFTVIFTICVSSLHLHCSEYAPAFQLPCQPSTKTVKPMQGQSPLDSSYRVPAPAIPLLCLTVYIVFAVFHVNSGRH